MYSPYTFFRFLFATYEGGRAFRIELELFFLKISLRSPFLLTKRYMSFEVFVTTESAGIQFNKPKFFFIKEFVYLDLIEGPLLDFSENVGTSCYRVLAELMFVTDVVRYQRRKRGNMYFNQRLEKHVMVSKEMHMDHKTMTFHAPCDLVVMANAMFDHYVKSSDIVEVTGNIPSINTKGEVQE